MAALAATGLCLGHLMWVTTGLGGPSVTRLVSRAAVAIASLAAAVGCARAAARSHDLVRRGWALLSLTAVCWLLGDAIPTYQEVVRRGAQGVPSPPTAILGVALILPLVAVLVFVAPALSGAIRTRTLLDGLLVASSLVLAGWVLALGDLYQATVGERGRALVIAYPLADIVVVSVLVVTVARMGRGGRLPWLLLLNGFALFALSHSAFADRQLPRGDPPGGLEDVTWVVGCVLVYLAALAPRKVLRPLTDAFRPLGLVPVLVPYLPVAVAAAVVTGVGRQRPTGLFPLVGGAVIATILVARQVLAQLENVQLERQLDARVGERTAELELQERHFRSLVQNAADLVTVVDADHAIRYQSSSVQHVLGFAPRELLGTRIEDLMHPDDRAQAMARLWSAPPSPALPIVVGGRLRRRNGGWCTAETSITNLVHDDSVRGFLLTTRDVGERQQLEDQLRHQALHDPLTGLANRTLLRDRLEHGVARSVRGPETLALVMVDLDDFKVINDTLGHPAGDRVLADVARRLFQGVRAGDTVARMGGDEFAVLLERTDEEALRLVTQRVLDWPRTTIDVDGKPLVIQASVGVAMGPTASLDPEELLRNADLAMYVAKSKGKGGYEVFHSGMHADLLEREQRHADLGRALRAGELVMHYQPVVDLVSGRIAGAEALVRWAHPERGLILPGEFMSLAEQSDLVLALGRWALTEACAQGQRWHAENPHLPRFTMAVNVAATRQLTSPMLAAEVREALDQSGFDPANLVLEITEGALMGDLSAIIPALHALKALDVQLAIDDFGEGWSSLSRLRSFPIDRLKIDRSFVREIGTSKAEASIVTAVVAMARSMGVSTVAEGVETVEQLSSLRQHGCHEVQGFLLSEPLSPSGFEALLEKTGGTLMTIEGIKPESSIVKLGVRRS